jgi:hypothetical protein
MHEKYIKRGNKRFGPYYYETYRENGQVKTSYIGKTPNKAPIPIILTIAVILAIASLFLVYNPAISSFTGHTIVLDKNTIQPNEQLSGNFEISLKEGEFIPSNSVITVEFDGNKKQMFLNEFLKLKEEVNLQEKAGSYYSSKIEISGSGPGYGWQGKKT